MATIVKPHTEITSPVIYRITDKETHEHFYLVKSDRLEHTFYEVHYNAQALAWQCQCPDKRPCEHERAVNEVLKVRRACLAAQMGGDTPAIVERMQREEDRKLALQERECERLTRDQYTEEFSIY